MCMTWMWFLQKISRYDNIYITISIQVINTWKRVMNEECSYRGIPRWCWLSLCFLQVWCTMEERTNSMADLWSCVRMTGTHKSIQSEGIVCSGQLSICGRTLDFERLRQLNNENNRRQVCGGEQDQVWHHLGIYPEHLVEVEYEESKIWSVWNNGDVNSKEAKVHWIAQCNDRCKTGFRAVCITLILALLFSVAFL